MMLTLDTRITEDLFLKGWKNEIIYEVQRKRKALNLGFDDPIVITYAEGSRLYSDYKKYKKLGHITQSTYDLIFPQEPTMGDVMKEHIYEIAEKTKARNIKRGTRFSVRKA